MTDSRARLLEALAARKPAKAVLALARAFRAEGMGQVAMYRLFSEQQARLDGNDPLYDVVVDTMDLIWGGAWAKGRDLFGEVLSEERLKSE